MSDENRPFKGVREAVLFALNYMGNPPRSAMSKAADPPRKNSEFSLSGLDGAAQAGMIKSRMQKTGKVGNSCLIARSANRDFPCHCGAACCTGSKPNFVWLEAILFLGEELAEVIKSRRLESMRGMKDDPDLRKLLAAKFFGSGMKLSEIAEKTSVSAATASAHWEFSKNFLNKKEADAWKELEDDLRTQKIIP